MPNTNTLIKLKRSKTALGDLIENEETLTYGEPLFFDDTENADKNKYLAIGNNINLSEATYFQGVTNTALLGKAVYLNNNDVIINANGDTVSSANISPTLVGNDPNEISTQYSLVSYNNTLTGSPNNVFTHTGIYVTGNGVLHGGAWNDYAEKRKCISGTAGQVVCEQGDGTLGLSKEKLQPLPYVISDTYGMAIGNEDSVGYYPVAVSGRVLVTVNCDVSVGDVLCADKNGFATKMTRNEISNYPDRVLGIVSEIPTYEKWNDVEINNRVWITIK